MACNALCVSGVACKYPGRTSCSCPAGNAESVRFIRNTPGLVPLAERQASKLRQTPLIERRLVQAIVAQASPLAGVGGKGTLQSRSAWSSPHSPLSELQPADFRS